MKTQRYVSIAFAALAILSAQSVSISAQADPQWNATGTFQYIQSNNANGQFNLVQHGSQITGTSTAILEASGAAPGADKITANGTIIGGKIEGSRLILSVSYQPVTKFVAGQTQTLWNGGRFEYDGGISPVGAVAGDMWETVHPESRFKFTFSSALPAGIATTTTIPTTTVPVTPRTFVGTWNMLSSAGKPSVMILNQTGNTISGTYSPNNGKIEGTVSSDGNLLIYKWSQDDGSRGSGKFTMNAVGNAFEGTYSYSENPYDNAGSWNGKRQ